jgi:ferredoxin
MVDPAKCMASQQCVARDPDLFALASAGHAQVQREVSASDISLLQEVEANCPTGAISVRIESDEAG